MQAPHLAHGTPRNGGNPPRNRTSQGQAAASRVKDMHVRLNHDWQNAIWKILTNPALEVVVAIVLVLIAAWFVIDTDAIQKSMPLAHPFGDRF